MTSPWKSESLLSIKANMSIFTYLFSFDVWARPKLACMMLACELEKVTLSEWTIGNKAPPWAVVGSSPSLASKAGLDLGPCLVPGLGTSISAHTPQLSTVPNGALTVLVKFHPYLLPSPFPFFQREREGKGRRKRGR